MTTADLSTLTPKQRQVYGLLQQGQKPGEIAKRMRIGAPGVYSHMRKIRAAGVTLPNEQLNGNTPEPEAAATNGGGPDHAVAAKRAVQLAVETAHGAVDDINAQLVEHQGHIDALLEERNKAQELLRRYQTALEALVA